MENVTLQIIANGMDGEGIAKMDGKVYFIDGGAVVGDEAICRINKDNKNFARAQVISLIKKSEHRCTPKCEYFEKCGGCSMQHIQYQKQLDIKRQNVQNLFDKFKLNAVVKNVIPSQKEWGYRNKVTLYKTDDKGLGFNYKNSNKLIAINECKLISKEFNKLIKTVNEFLKQNGDFSFILKGMAIREVDGIYLINLILKKKILTTKFENYLKLNKINYSLYYCVNTKSNLPTYPTIFVGGKSEIFVEEFGIRYPVYPLSFLQVNGDVKRMIYEEILLNIEKDKVVLDAYSGAGLMSAIIAKKSAKVYAVEIDESASKASSKLSEINGIGNLISINGDCKNEVPNILQSDKIDVVVMDPARKGADAQTLTAIIDEKIKRIIYLSCNPATLARDVDFLSKGGYKIKSVQPYDMFPQTSEVETLVIMDLE